KGAPDEELLRSQYYMSASNVPSTNLRYEDFIFGTVDQLKKALNDISAGYDMSLFAVVQAPGTSLLSEVIEPELKAISKETGVPYIYVETPGLSENMLKGHDETVVKILKTLSEPGLRGRSENKCAEKERPSVNIFGLGSRDFFGDGDLEELTGILSLCGIDVNCAPGAFCTVDELKNVYAADANIYLSPERCKKTEEYMNEVSDMPSLSLGCMPIGPDLCESFVRGISSLLGTDCSRAIEDIEKARSRIFYQLARRMGGRGFSGDIKYAAEGEASLLYALTDYLSGYLGMAPECLHVLYRPVENEQLSTAEAACSQEEGALGALLASFGEENALGKDISQVKDVIFFGNANSIAHLLAYSGNVYGVEISSPGSGYINVIPKTLIGPTGALYILEHVLNARRLLSAWV
ncbi:MAG: hypothetical protein J5528_05510, partial [Firmicutes bacterium]|nr:hypothetical protein [Bacillota bacterium]